MNLIMKIVKTIKNVIVINVYLKVIAKKIAKISKKNTKVVNITLSIQKLKASVKIQMPKV